VNFSHYSDGFWRWTFCGCLGWTWSDGNCIWCFLFLCIIRHRSEFHS